MFKPSILNLMRRMQEPKNRNDSTKYAAGAAVGLLATGSGVLPALVAFSGVLACAGAVRGLWDEYKTKKHNHQELYSSLREALESSQPRNSPQDIGSLYNLATEKFLTLSRSGEMKIKDVQNLAGLNERIMILRNNNPKSPYLQGAVFNSTKVLESSCDQLARTSYADAMTLAPSNNIAGALNKAHFISTALDAQVLNQRHNPGAHSPMMSEDIEGRYTNLRLAYDSLANTVPLLDGHPDLVENLKESLAKMKATFEIVLSSPNQSGLSTAEPAIVGVIKSANASPWEPGQQSFSM